MDDNEQREKPREIKDGPQNSQDHEKSKTNEPDKADDGYRYTDWASI